MSKKELLVCLLELFVAISIFTLLVSSVYVAFHPVSLVLCWFQVSIGMSVISMFILIFT